MDRLRLLHIVGQSVLPKLHSLVQCAIPLVQYFLHCFTPGFAAHTSQYSHDSLQSKLFNSNASQSSQSKHDAS